MTTRDPETIARACMAVAIWFADHIVYPYKDDHITIESALDQADYILEESFKRTVGRKGK